MNAPTTVPNPKQAIVILEQIMMLCEQNDSICSNVPAGDQDATEYDAYRMRDLIDRFGWLASLARFKLTGQKPEKSAEEWMLPPVYQLEGESHV